MVEPLSDTRLDAIENSIKNANSCEFVLPPEDLLDLVAEIRRLSTDLARAQQWAEADTRRLDWLSACQDATAVLVGESQCDGDFMHVECIRSGTVKYGKGKTLRSAIDAAMREGQKNV